MCFKAQHKMCENLTKKNKRHPTTDYHKKYDINGPHCPIHPFNLMSKAMLVEIEI